MLRGPSDSRQPRRSLTLVAACLVVPLLLGCRLPSAEAAADGTPDLAHSQTLAPRAAGRLLRSRHQRRVLAGGIGLARRLRLTGALHRLIALLPQHFAGRVDNARRDLRMLAGDPAPAAAEDEVEPAFRAALELLARRNRNGDGLGDYLEFGVYVGTSMACMHRALRDLGHNDVRLFGFDSFEGLPSNARHEEDGYWRPGMYRADIEVTRERLTEAGVDWDRTTLVEGWFDETLTPARAAELGLERAGVVMVDCDLYSSTTQALAFVEPLLTEEAVLVFDDWAAAGGGDDRLVGERQAFEEFLAAHPELEATERPELRYSDTAAVFLVSRRALT
jgi:O-methyltransferase